jgi:hypothetical protein
MRGVWLAIAIGVIAGVGCTSTPKRQMRQPAEEEFVSPTDNYKDPPDYSRDQPVLVPKSTTPGLNTPQVPGMGAPTGAGAGAPGSATGARH